MKDSGEKLASIKGLDIKAYCNGFKISKGNKERDKMNNKFKKQIAAALIVGILLGGFSTLGISKAFGENGKLSKLEYYKILDQRYGKLYQLDELITKNYYKPVDRDKLYVSMYKGLFKGLKDPYSEYMTKKEYDKMIRESADNYVGTGTILEKNKDNQIVVTEVFEGGPAKEAGIKKGDIILKVDGKAYSGDKVTQASKAMRGKEGTQVVLTIKQAGSKKEKEFKIIRRVIKSTSVYGEVIKGVKGEKLGYIRITAFHERVANDFINKVKALDEEGVKGYIIDLRYNGGGYVDEAMKVADELLPAGVICYAKDNMGGKEEYKSAAGRIDKPYVLLINEFSASASEMIAAGVKDMRGGKIIGSTSFGKGIIQSTLRLDDGDGIKLTTMEYFSQKGNAIHNKGVKPDIVVKSSLEDETDHVLERAKVTLEGEIKGGN